MHLFEAIVDANHRAVAGDREVSLPLEQFADALPVVALTCIDARLNRLLPNVLGVPEEHFVWLRNAGNIITGPLSSTMRSLALACALKGGKEIVILGHTDCRAGQATMAKLIDAFQGLGIARTQLPADLTEFFGLFASEQQNVSRGVDFVRNSPLIGPRIPVHGLLLDLSTGRVDWVVNGYQAIGTTAARWTAALQQTASFPGLLAGLAGMEIGTLSVPTSQIGDASSAALAVPPETSPPSAMAGRTAPTPPSLPKPASPSKPPPVLPKPRFFQAWKRKR